MYDVHPRNMLVLVLALMLSSFRLAGAVAPAAQHLPARQLSLATVAQDQGHFSTCLAACQTAGLDTLLSGRRHYTMFMPNDLAFRKLPAGVADALLSPANHELLAATLKQHLLSGSRHSAALAQQATARTLAGTTVSLQAQDGQPARFGDAHVLGSELPATNGVLYEVDEVQLPESVIHALAQQHPELALESRLQAAGVR